MLTRIFGPKKNNMRLKEMLHNLYLSLNIIRIMRSRIIRQGNHVTYMEIRNVYKMLVEMPIGRDQTAIPGTDGKMDLTEIW